MTIKSDWYPTDALDKFQTERMVLVAHMVDNEPIPFEALQVDKATFEEEQSVWIRGSLSAARRHGSQLWQRMSSAARITFLMIPVRAGVAYVQHAMRQIRKVDGYKPLIGLLADEVRELSRDLAAAVALDTDEPCDRDPDDPVYSKRQDGGCLGDADGCWGVYSTVGADNDELLAVVQTETMADAVLAVLAGSQAPPTGDNP